MIEIEASVLSSDFLQLGEQAHEAEMAGVDGIQVDVMDGRFVPNITFGQGIVRALRKILNVTLDVHLMIVEPERYIEEFAEAGANRIFVHQEACTHLHRVLSHIRELGVEAGIALNPSTPAGVVEEVLDVTDIIQVMTVNPGFGGQEILSIASSIKLAGSGKCWKNTGMNCPSQSMAVLTQSRHPLGCERPALP